jgi:hypothetical protein
MKLWQAYPTLRIELMEVQDGSGDFLLQFVHNEEWHWKFERIGFFIKQPDRTFNFKFSTELEKRNFAEIIQSDDPIKTFLKLHAELKEKHAKGEFTFFKEE